MTADRTRIMQLALGRIFLLGSRPTQPGDVEEYERCRRVILDAAEPAPETWQPNYARDRNRGHDR